MSGTRRSARIKKIVEEIKITVKQKEEQKEKISKPKKSIKTDDKLGFILYRIKYYLGEGIDISLPTDDGAFGTHIIDHCSENGRKHKIDELITELSYILYGKDDAYDDKFNKRLKRYEFLKFVREDTVLTQMYNDIIYYLNGHDIYYGKDTKEQVVVCISGGNIILIFATLLLLLKYVTEYHLLSNYKLFEIIGIKDYNNLRNYVMTKIKDENFWNNVKILSRSNPSDLDFKLCPGKIETLKETTKTQNGGGKDFDDFDKNLKNLLEVAKHIDRNHRSYNIPPLQKDKDEDEDAHEDEDEDAHEDEDEDEDQHYEIPNANDNINAINMFDSDEFETNIYPLIYSYDLKQLIERRSEELSKLYQNDKIKPGPNTKHLFTQIVQKEDLKIYKDNKGDTNYIEYLLKEKERISLSTSINSACIVYSGNISRSIPPVFWLMITIHVFSILFNYNINKNLKDNNIDINRDHFKDLMALKGSPIIKEIIPVLEIAQNSDLWAIFKSNVNDAYEYNINEIDGVQNGVWVAPELRKIIGDSIDVLNYDEKTRITINVINQKDVSELSKSIRKVKDREKEMENLGNIIINLKSNDNYNKISKTILDNKTKIDLDIQKKDNQGENIVNITKQAYDLLSIIEESKKIQMGDNFQKIKL